MRYPVGDTGSLSEFQSKWYSAQKFGNPTSYGLHDGEDFNLLTGGDTDLGQELKSIANGRIVYYHNASHPTTGFGRHMVVKIDGPWGTRWAHYAHCDSITANSQDVTEGQIIGRLGKTGTPYAHLHFALYKVDPVGFGIDNFPNTLVELNQYWEDPIAFINTWMVAPVPTPQPDIRLSLLDQAGILTEGDTRRAIDRDRNYPNLEQEKNNLQNSYNSLKDRIRVNVNNAITQS